MHALRILWFGLGLVALSAWTTAAQADALERDALLESLRDGGLVIYWRHANWAT